MSEFYEQFNYLRYGGDVLARPMEQGMGNKGMKISITRIATKLENDVTLNFKAFITAFNETYAADWQSEEIYGRADPVPIFKNTRRKITLVFKVPAVNKGEAYENLGKVQKLTQFLYPTYVKQAGRDSMSQTISRSPLVRLKFMNLIRNTNGISVNLDQSANQMFKDYDMGGEGLLGVITNVIVLHNLGENTGVIEKGSQREGLQAILPKMIEINLDFEPIHEHPLGWDLNGVFGRGTTYDATTSTYSNGETFPYGVVLEDAAQAAAAAEAQDAAIKDAVYGDDPGAAFTASDTGEDTAENLVDEQLPPEQQAPSEEADEASSATAAADSQVASSESTAAGATGDRLTTPPRAYSPWDPDPTAGWKPETLREAEWRPLTWNEYDSSKYK